MESNTPQEVGGEGASRSLEVRLGEEVERSRRHRLPLALVFLRIEVPGTACPVPGALTEALALLSRAVVRDSDTVLPLANGRLAVVANASPEGAAEMARVLASELEAFQFTCGDRRLDLRVRFAVASLVDGMGPGELVRAAAEALECGCAERTALGTS